VLGGTQSLHTNGYDEALSLPTEEAATLALRTQQILAAETGVTATADPLAGSWFVESLTDQLEEKAREWIDRIDEQGGAVSAIERGYMQNAIAENAYRRELDRNAGRETVVGVNRYVDDSPASTPIQRIDQTAVQEQIARVTAYKGTQDTGCVGPALEAVSQAAQGEANLLPVMKQALLAGATLGQICDQLRGVFGEHRPGA
jgi:methylmalonyl-CoA mutase N-terminal domain/subunit